MLRNGHVRFGGRGEETDQSRDRHRASPRPNTYVRTWCGFVYAAFAIDLYSRAILGWWDCCTNR